MNPSTAFAAQESTHVDPCVSDPWASDDDAEWGAEVPAEAIALDSIVRRLSSAEREIRQAEARRVEIFAEAFDLAALSSRVIRGGQDVSIDSTIPVGAEAQLKFRSIRAELAAELKLSEATIERRMTRAWELTQCYSTVFEAYRDGDVSEQHVNVILDAGRIVGLQDEVDTSFRRSAYASQVLEYAVETSPNRLRPIARQIAEQYAETPLDERHAEARRRRNVCVYEAEDGMADLYAHLPAAEAYAIHDRLVRMGKLVAEREARAESDRGAEWQPAAVGEGRADRGALGGEPSKLVPAVNRRRSRDEIRADLLSDLLLNGDTDRIGELNASTVRGQVQVLVPSERLLTAPAASGHAPLTPSLDELFNEIGKPTTPPAPIMNGYGPIDSETARRIAGESDAWEAIRVDSRSFEVIEVDRYRPSEQMRRYLRARDQHCRFPGCRAAISRCDIDHTIDAARGGPTSTNNLAYLCRGHHTLKHHGGWSVVQNDGGVLDWTSPTGRGYRESPPSKVKFRPADDRTHPF